MTLNEMLTKLDRATVNGSLTADARRTASELACSLRARSSRAERASKLRNALEKLSVDRSNQGDAKRENLSRELENLGDTDLGSLLHHTQRQMRAWGIG